MTLPVVAVTPVSTCDGSALSATVVLAVTDPDAPPAEIEPLLVVIVPVPPTETPVPVVATTPTDKVSVPAVTYLIH